MTTLLDANVLIALTDPDHVHHDAAADWFQEDHSKFATCPITQGALVRAKLRAGHDSAAAQTTLKAITEMPEHEFWPDSISFAEVRLDGVLGHRQVTDAYLAQLARELGGKLATFDRGLAALHKDVAALVPSD